MIDHVIPTPADNEQISSVLGKTTHDQHRASNPENSAWVSANAGSGKTYVLAQRVTRLLLNGVPPSKILCLTFTKAAAAEMSNRVFKQLGEWAILDEETLLEEIVKTGERNPSGDMLRRARLLFTRALESPGGLKVQTIHAFCEALLHQFTLEANTSGHFTVMGDFEQKSLLENARKSMLAETRTRPELAQALHGAMGYGSDQAIEKGLDNLIKEREGFARWIRTNDDSPEIAVARLALHMGVDLDDTKSELASRLLSLLPISETKLLELGLAASHFPQTECERIATAVKAIGDAKDPTEKLQQRINLYSTAKAGQFRKKIGVKAYLENISGSKELFAQELDMMPDIYDQLKQWQMLHGSLSLFKLADCVLQFYSDYKRSRGLLDYDDLINRTADLLARSDVRQWVQYKLDAGIDHILVDEAQDTSPVQWEIINALIEEYFAGHSSRQSTRTVFAVGDQKQSIYSFQGAEPEMFTRQKNQLGSQANEAGMHFEDVSLDISFRSTQDVLSAVDAVFSNPVNADGLQPSNQPIIHQPNRQSDPGEVQIWPMIESPKKNSQEDWLLPVDHLSEDHPAVQLAKTITSTIKGWIEGGEGLPGKGRNITYGDILILVRKRDRFAGAITKELKQAGLAVAGADRLSLASHIAIEDLLSLASWVLFPEDDLALAEVLKSPLFEFNDEMLFSFCADRGEKTLWRSINSEDQTNLSPHHSSVIKSLSHLLRSSKTQTPYEFFADILSTQKGRKKFKARLGDEVDDVLDAFLLEALDHTLNGGSGLQEFIHTLETASPDIKRELDLKRDEIRVMTVHSAKGLEAPIVFLVDPGSVAFSSSHRPAIVTTPMENQLPGFLWQPDKKAATDFTESIFQQITEKAEQEYRRLLYVGMTRAEDKLIMCGYANRNAGSNPTWHKMVHDALVEDCTRISDNGTLRWNTPHPQRKARKIESGEKAKDNQQHTLPDWISTQPIREQNIMPPLSPSLAHAHLETSPREQDIIMGQSNSHSGFALERGNTTHYLLQTLPQIPQEKRRAYASGYMENNRSNWSNTHRDEITIEIFNILENPQFVEVFGQNSHAELSISGILDPSGINRQVTGQIDRISLTGDNVLIVDYKTDRRVPDSADEISQQYLLQLAIYQQLVSGIYPDKSIRSAFIWTTTATIMEIPNELLDNRLESWLKEVRGDDNLFQS